MKRSLLLTLALLMGFIFQTSATHIMGSDIEYKCLGNGKYAITLRIYRDCEGVQLSSLARLSFSSSDCVGQNFTDSAFRIAVRDITPTCGAVVSFCNGGSLKPAIEEHTYLDTVDLGTTARANCCKWKFSWSSCCRNSTINTGQAGQGYYTEAEIDRCKADCNTSPSLTNVPVMILCRNQDQVLNMGATDTTDANDSLVYKLIAAEQSQGSPTSYSGQYSPTRPLQFLGFPNTAASLPSGFHLNGVTGDLSFRPILAQKAVIVIQVKEYRKDTSGNYQLIGTTKRDIQVIVVNCMVNNNPTLPAMATQEVCAGSNICFGIASGDPDSTNSTTISWNRGIPTATFTTTNGIDQNAKGTFCWTPTAHHVRNMPYTFTVTARDNNCPIMGSVTRSYSVKVKGIPRANRYIRKLACGEYSFDAQLLEPCADPVYEWNVEGTTYTTPQAHHKFTTGGVKVIRLTVTCDSCSGDTYNDTIRVDAPPTNPVVISLPEDSCICANSSIDIEAGVFGGIPDFQYTWSHSQDTTQKVSVSPTVTTVYKVMVTDSLGCSSEDSMKVEVKAIPEADFTFMSNGLTVDFTNTSSGGSSYEWDFGDSSTTSSLQDPTHTYSKSGIYDVTLIVKDSTATCTDTISQTININALSVAETIVDRYVLQAYPNPYIGTINISFQLTNKTPVALEVIDALGKQVQRLVQEELPAGTYQYSFSAAKLGLSSGVYMVTLITPEGKGHLRIVELE